jgi:hypothetical protein
MCWTAGAILNLNGQGRKIDRNRVRGLTQMNQNRHKRCLKWVGPIKMSLSCGLLMAPTRYGGGYATSPRHHHLPPYPSTGPHHTSILTFARPTVLKFTH